MGASSWWGTTNRQPPLASTPNGLEINVDLTPIKLIFGSEADFQNGWDAAIFIAWEGDRFVDGFEDRLVPSFIAAARQ